MSSLSKVVKYIGNAYDRLNTYFSPLKQRIVQGFNKAGKFLDNHHETIGAIASGIGTTLQNLPNGEIKDRLGKYGETFTNIGSAISAERPSNLARQSLSVFLNNQHNNRQLRQEMVQKPQTPAIQSVNVPIQQPAFTGPQRNYGNNIVSQPSTTGPVKTISQRRYI